LVAQQLPAPLFARSLPAGSSRLQPAGDFDTGRAVAAGVLGTLAGYAVGGVIGHQFDQDCDVCVGMAFLGAFVGASVGTPLAVHLSNGRQGRLGPAVLASFAITAGGLGAAVAAHDGRIVLAIPILQIASAVSIERRTASD
jgi:hypothetical protein